MCSVYLSNLQSKEQANEMAFFAQQNVFLESNVPVSCCIT